MRLNLKQSNVLDRMSTDMNAAEPARAILGESPLTATESGCGVRVISTDAEFDELETAWSKLLDESDATVFQSFEWSRTWWKYYAKPNQELDILVFTIDNKIVAIAPLFKEVIGLPGMRLFSRLQFLGRGLSDYGDIIIRDGYEQPVLTSLVLHLRATAKGWDVFDIEDVNESSPVMKHLQGIMDQHGLNMYLYQGNVCPQIQLSASESSSPTNSYNFRRKLKKLKQNFTVEVELLRSDTEDLRSAIDAFAAVHGNRWKSQGYWSAFDDERNKAFHAEVAKRFACRNWLRLYFLKVDSIAVAASFHFNYNKRIYMYQSNVHGTEAVMKCSPGYLIRTLSIADGIKEGMQVFDFLRGDEPYKYTEGNAVDSRNYLMRCSSPALSGKIRFAMYLGYELLVKSRERIGREYYEYRKFTLSKKRSQGDKALYVWRKIADIGVLGYNFIVRHLPARSLQKFQIGRRSRQ